MSDFKAKIHQIRSRSAPDPTGGAYSTPPRSFWTAGKEYPSTDPSPSAPSARTPLTSHENVWLRACPLLSELSGVPTY